MAHAAIPRQDLAYATLNANGRSRERNGRRVRPEGCETINCEKAIFAHPAAAVNNTLKRVLGSCGQRSGRPLIRSAARGGELSS